MCYTIIEEGNKIQNLIDKLTRFAEVLEKQHIERLHKQQLDCGDNIHNSKVNIKEGKKYFKVDMGGSGKYMVDLEDNIYGIKAYGQVHKGHKYGTLDTIDLFYWGDYRGYRL